MTDLTRLKSGESNESAVCTAVFCRTRPDIEIIELNQSTATVALAAAAHNVEPGQIAKTLSLKIKDKIVLIVARGDARLDNKKLKETFGAKARMLSSDEVVTWTGHPVGGVCPFGLENPLAVYCDVSQTLSGSTTRSGSHP